MIVGLTGGIGSGKSTIVTYFRDFKNVAIYIADDEAKKLMCTSAVRLKLINLLGKNTFVGQELQRKYIADIVFKNPKKLKELNNIVHPVVQNHFTEFIKLHNEADYILYENAILFENKNQAICNVVICVTTPLEIRIERLLKRDATTKAAIALRMKNQWSETKKTFQSNYIIENIFSEVAENEVKRIHNILTKNYSRI